MSLVIALVSVVSVVIGVFLARTATFVLCFMFTGVSAILNAFAAFAAMVAFRSAVISVLAAALLAAVKVAMMRVAVFVAIGVSRGALGVIARAVGVIVFTRGFPRTIRSVMSGRGRDRQGAGCDADSHRDHETGNSGQHAKSLLGKTGPQHGRCGAVSQTRRMTLDAIP